MDGLIAFALAKKGAAQQISDALGDISTNVTFKGSVAAVENLPSTATIGDEYVVGSYGIYVYNGTEWINASRKGEKGEKGEKGDPGSSAGWKVASVTLTEKVAILSLEINKNAEEILISCNITKDSGTSSNLWVNAKQTSGIDDKCISRIGPYTTNATNCLIHAFIIDNKICSQAFTAPSEGVNWLSNQSFIDFRESGIITFSYNSGININSGSKVTIYYR